MEERQKVLREYIMQRNEVGLEELCALLPQVSAMTVRRDLGRLEEAGFVIRTHGGARLNPMHGLLERSYHAREVEHMVEKEQIAQKACGFLEERRAVYIDSGTTAMAFARSIPDIPLTVITSGPNIALDLAVRRPSASITLLGGTLNHHTLSVSGRHSLSLVDGVNVDTAFMCASGFTVDTGFTNGNLDERDIKRSVIAQARRVVMLMDLSKLGRTLPYTFAQLEDIDYLVCEGDLPEGIKNAAEKAGAEVL